MRWYGEIAPSPVFCRQPAPAAPRLSASMAFLDSAPKLIPEMLTTEPGRKAWVRPRGPPRILAEGSRTSSPTWIAVGAPGPVNVRCLITG